MTPTQEALCEGDSSSLTLSSSPVESCASSCTPLSYNCSEDALTITYADQVLCNEELDTAKYDTCQCQVFWYGNDCTTHFIDVYPSTSRGYSIFFCVVFLGLSIFSGREIYKHVTELEESAKKLNKQISNRNGGKTNEMGRRRSSTLQFNRPKSMGRTTMVSGFFQPTRVRILVQSCCFLASFLRFIYLFNMTLRVCYEGQVCSSVVFEPANIAIISAGLLTVMFWKKMGMMFRKGVNQATQNDEDIRFFQIFGFYTIFQFTMIVVTATAESMNIEMHALYNISLLVSGIYMIGLLYGSIKFGMTLIRLLHGTRKGGDGDAKAKTWKKVRKVVYMLSIVVPAGVGYLISLGVYMMMGMRGIPKMWMPMQVRGEAYRKGV